MLGAVLMACGGDDLDPDAGAMLDAPTPMVDAPREVVDVGPPDVPVDAGPPPAIIDLSFDPSNVGARAHGRPYTPFRCTTGETFQFDTDVARMACTRSSTSRRLVDVPGSIEVIDQPDGAPQLVVFYVDRLIMREDYGVLFTGARPFVIVAQGEIVIAARVTATGGGFPSAVCPPASPGVGPGGGGYSTASTFGGGGEGGAHCTLGGLGAGMTFAEGLTNGAPELIPLVGGSSGGVAGSPSYPGHSGAGGGAMQFVSATRIEIQRTAILSASAANFGSMAPSDGSGRFGAGGGAGGAILLEAPEVVVDGALFALGSDGGGGTLGGGAATSTTPAEPGARSGTSYGGGGEGLGRIRINTATSPMVAVDAALAPSLGSTCASFGPLLPATSLPTANECAATPSDPTICESCLDDGCCAEVTACADSALCTTCASSSMPGPGCGMDTAYVAWTTCRRTRCASACEL